MANWTVNRLHENLVFADAGVYLRVTPQFQRWWRFDCRFKRARKTLAAL
jgi:hypothetical protein